MSRRFARLLVWWVTFAAMACGAGMQYDQLQQRGEGWTPLGRVLLFVALLGILGCTVLCVKIVTRDRDGK